MNFSFTDYVRAGCPDDQLQGAAELLRRWLRSELKSRGHLQSPPSPLGYSGSSWYGILDPSLLSEPVVDLWSYVFVDRQTYLSGLADSGKEIQALVRKLLKQWIAARLREHSPVEHAVVKNCEGAIARLQDEGLARLKDDGTILIGRPPAVLGDGVLQHHSVAGAARLCGTRSRKAQRRLAEALRDAVAGRTARIEWSSLRRAVRAEAEEQIRRGEASDGIPAPPNRDDRYETRLRVIAGLRVVSSGTGETSERRARLAALVRERCESGEDCSVRTLAAIMGVALSTISNDLVRLADASEDADG